MLLRIVVGVLLLLSIAAAQAIELRAADSAPPGAMLAVQVIGDVAPRSFVSIVSASEEAGGYDAYAYVDRPNVSTAVPAEPGDYELRLMGAETPYPVLASRPLNVVMPSATLEADDAVPISTQFTIRWSGPGGSREYITLVAADAPDKDYEEYDYLEATGQGEVQLSTPAQSGAFEIRYVSGRDNVIYARRPLSVGDVSASVSFSPSATMGSTLSVDWKGPANARDFITVVPPDADSKAYTRYAYTTQSPVKVQLPETPGKYEVRYLSADSSRIYARGALTVGAAEATLKAPPSVEAHTAFEVSYTGPNNEGDYIAVTEAGKPKEYLSYSYTRRGSPLSVRAPRQSGDFEVHYLTGQQDISLASLNITVTPGAALGSLKVLADSNAATASGAALAAGATHIELILDASGSMLQKIAGQRRIDLARRALKGLVQSDIASGTPVALRVFGHTRPDSCDTELVQALAPLDRASLSQIIDRLEAKNLAKTPIGASLAAVADDMAGVEGSATVVLVTDGEETCGGDPAKEIERLRTLGFSVTLNVVGFAIDEYALEQEFRRWAELGGGAYFSAADGAALAASVSAALRTPFSVYQGGRRVADGVVGGSAVELKAGTYEVRIGKRRNNVDIVADQERALTF